MKGNFENDIEQAKVDNKQRSWEAPEVVILEVEGTENGATPEGIEDTPSNLRS